MFETILSSVKNKKPMIHCITNPISITRCADAILAVGAKPIMAEHPKEVEEITKRADALVLNLGNITDARMESMVKSARVANENNIPFVVDAVGIACSTLRKDYVKELLKHKPSVVKGNYSEIKALYDEEYKTRGVDADFSDMYYIKEISKKLAEKYRCIILASGKEDIISNEEKTFAVRNGTQQLAQITGTGCMLGALCGCFLSVLPNVYGVLTACGVMGICGERAKTELGNGTFAVKLIDALSRNLKEEEFKIEEI